MKIFKKQTISELGNEKIKQTAWVVGKTSIQTEFTIDCPSYSENVGCFGSLELSLNQKIDRIVFTLCPNDFYRNRQAYQETNINFVEFSGDYTAKLESGARVMFGHPLAIQPKLEDLGWCFEFDNAIVQSRAVPSEHDSEMTSEEIIAGIVCTECFKVSVGRRYELQGEVMSGRVIPRTGIDLFASVVLQDIEGLRLAITDVLGVDYLRKLLRKNGYELDASSLSWKTRE